MNRALAGFVICFSLLLAGCEGLRFSPSEIEKQNAWLHNRTTVMTAETAKAEQASEKLQKLTDLSKLQSQSFVSYYGVPKDIPQADSAEAVLTESNFLLGQEALRVSADRPDPFALAGSALDLAIGISALFGGVYGVRALQFFKTAKQKSEALQEIIVGNELFKQQNSSYASAFKDAHKEQSPETRQLVAQMKS